MKFSEAKEHTWSDGCKERCGQCPECSLCVCTVCGTYEGGLTTHCPGEGYDSDVRKVYEGEVDYIYGQWVAGLRNTVMIRSARDYVLNREKLLMEMRKEPEVNKVFIEEVEQDLLTRIHYCVEKDDKEGVTFNLRDDSISFRPWEEHPVKYFSSVISAKKELRKLEYIEEEIDACRFVAQYKPKEERGDVK